MKLKTNAWDKFSKERKATGRDIVLKTTHMATMVWNWIDQEKTAHIWKTLKQKEKKKATH